MRWLACLLMLAGCSEPEEVSAPVVSGIAAEETFTKICATCHGAAGQGKVELKAPAIAGLPAWYIKEQVANFKKGYRGVNPADVAGTQMKAIADSLTDLQLESAAAAVHALPPIATAKSVVGEVDRGRAIFAESCMACHRFNGQGERIFHSAPLVSLNPQYLTRQLENYAKGWRGSHPQDFYGHKMVDVASGLSDRDIADLVGYIGELAHGDDPRKAMAR